MRRLAPQGSPLLGSDCLGSEVSEDLVSGLHFRSGQKKIPRLRGGCGSCGSSQPAGRPSTEREMRAATITPGCLFVPQGVDRIQLRSFAGRVEAEEDPDSGADKKGANNPFRRDKRRPTCFGGDEF